MTLYFQFMTQNQTAEAIEMLRLIPVLTDSRTLKGHATISAQASISRCTFLDLDALIAKMEAKRFNQLEVALERTQLAGRLADIASLKGFFSPSPTCALWLPTRDWSIEADRASRNKYMTARSSERTINFHHVSRAPSVFGLLVAVTTNLAQHVVLDGCADWLVRAFPESLEGLHLFGCCDVAEPVFIPQLKTSVLMHERFEVMMKVKPPAYPELGDRFEALHPLMFGSKRLCVGISNALGKDTKLRTASNASDFAVVRLAPGCDKESARIRAADWLISDADKLT
jgi:hypothetical protein